MATRRLLLEHLVEPGTGKAVPVLRGQILRLEQVEGSQCADFNAFNLRDHLEYFHAGRTRIMHGFFPTVGDMLWSNALRDRPMYTIVADTAGTNDVLYPPCSAFIYEYYYGFTRHTNCQEMQAEAQREYGLSPDRVHDTFNFCMHTGIDEHGNPHIKRSLAKAGDYVELLAHIDTLACANPCGDDVFGVSNFDMHSLKLQVLEATAEERERWLLSEEPQWATQLSDRFTPGRALVRDPVFEPAWAVYPIVKKRFEVELTPDESRLLDGLRANGGFGAEGGEIVRAAVLSWWSENRMHDRAHVDLGRR